MHDLVPIISAKEVSFSIGGHSILIGIDILVRAGEIVSVIGPNGAGKTTLLKLLLGQINPTRGHIWRKPNLRVGYVPQRLSIDPVLPMTARRFLALSGEKNSAIFDHVMAEVGISGLLDHPVQDISGGELQRLLLARALIRMPELLVLDEPAQGVDITGQAEIYQLIADIRHRQGCGVLLVSHDLHMVMAATDQVLCLNKHLCCAGHPEAVSQHPEYISLFGAHVAAGLAPYTHRHDHHHGIAGDVKIESESLQPHDRHHA